MIQSIVVPLDGSQYSEQSLSWALSIASKAGATLQIVHVLEPLSAARARMTATGIEFYSDIAQREWSRYLQSWVNRIQEHTPKISVSVQLLHGDPTEALCRYAEQIEGNLMVMSTHGRGAMGRFWLGSVADRMIRRAPVPLLLTHASSEQSPDAFSKPSIQKILIPFDMDCLAASVLPTASSIAKLWDAAVLLFHVLEPSRSSYERQMAASLGPNPPPGPEEQRNEAEKLIHQAETMLEEHVNSLTSREISTQSLISRSSSPAVAILDQARDADVDLIAMATHGRSGFSRFFLGSIADKVIRGSTVPILLYRPGSD